MTLDNGWMIAMVGMFGVFLIGIWLEARRSLRALMEDDFGLNEVVACEADYDAILTRLEARSRLSQIRSSMIQSRHESQSTQTTRTATYNLAGGYVPARGAALEPARPAATARPAAAVRPAATVRPVRKRLAPNPGGANRGTGAVEHNRQAGHNRMARHRLPHQPVTRRQMAQRPLTHNGFNLG